MVGFSPVFQCSVAFLNSTSSLGRVSRALSLPGIAILLPDLCREPGAASSQ